MYGNRDTQMKFYHYLGRLEDVPTIRKCGENSRQLVSINEFKEFIDDVEGIDEVSLQDWIREISEYVPRSQILQMVKFQKSGGLDNASSIFPVKLKGQDTYDQAFFYQIIAPELLSGFFEDNPKLKRRVLPVESLHQPHRLQRYKKKLMGIWLKTSSLKAHYRG